MNKSRKASHLTNYHWPTRQAFTEHMILVHKCRICRRSVFLPVAAWLVTNRWKAVTTEPFLAVWASNGFVNILIPTPLATLVGSRAIAVIWSYQ